MSMLSFKTLDIEYRFDDKMPTPQNSKHDKWRKMTFGKGGSTFVSDTRVKLPFLKPIVYGVINFFRTEVMCLVYISRADPFPDSRAYKYQKARRWRCCFFLSWPCLLGGETAVATLAYSIDTLRK